MEHLNCPPQHLRLRLCAGAGGGVAWGPNVPTAASAAAGGAPLQPELRRERLMDAYHQHTQHCPHCLRALRGIRAACAALLLAGERVEERRRGRGSARSRAAVLDSLRGLDDAAARRLLGQVSLPGWAK